MFDPDRFVERAAIMEFDGGLSRYQAETEAAKAQGVARWKALQEVENANRSGNLNQGGHHGSPLVGNGSDNLPGVQRNPQEQDGSLSIGDVHGGRSGVALLALPEQGRGVL